MENWYSQSKGIPCTNDSGEIIPPFACMQISDTEFENNEIILTVIKPTTAGIAKGPGKLVFNGEIEIPIDGNGFALVGDVCHAIEASAVTEGDECGPADASWKLSSSGTGYWKLASDDSESGSDDVMVVRRGAAATSSFRLFMSPGGGIPARSGTAVSHASCTEYKLVAGVLTTNSTSKDVYNPWPVDIPNSYPIVASQESLTGFWIAQFPGVIDVRWIDPDLEQTLDGTNYDNIDTAEDCP